MTERDAFLAAIIESPDDDTPRLVFADWLEEHGEVERAEFIRLDIKLSHLRPGPDEHRKAANIIARYQKRAPVRLTADTPATMLARRAILLTAWSKDEDGEPTVGGDHTYEWFGDVVRRFGRGHVEISRGFVSAVTMFLPDMMPENAAIAFSQPIEAIRLPRLSLSLEIDPPGKDYGWQLYGLPDNDPGSPDLLHSYETRAELVADIPGRLAEYAEAVSGWRGLEGRG